MSIHTRVVREDLWLCGSCKDHLANPNAYANRGTIALLAEFRATRDPQGLIWPDFDPAAVHSRRIGRAIGTDICPICGYDPKVTPAGVHEVFRHYYRRSLTREEIIIAKLVAP